MPYVRATQLSATCLAYSKNCSMGAQTSDCYTLGNRTGVVPSQGL